MADQVKWLTGLGLLVTAMLSVGCTTTTADVGRTEFVESQQVRTLNARIETLNVKLEDERKAASDAAVRADLLDRELTKLRELRRQDQIQQELMGRLLEDQRNKLDAMRIDASAMKTLQEDVVRLNNIIKDRDAELARLRAQIEQDRRADGTTK